MPANLIIQQLPCKVSTTNISSASSTTILLTRNDLRNRGISYSNPHLIELERRGRFPCRVTLSPAKVAWIEAEIDQWLNRRIASRSSSHGVRS